MINSKGFFDLLMASLLIAVYTYLFFKGLTMGKAGAGGVLVTVLNPIITYAVTLAIARRKPSRNVGLWSNTGAARWHRIVKAGHRSW